MASLKELKKDIDYLVYEVVSDCFSAMYVNDGKHSDEIAEIVADAVKLRNELFSRAKHPEGKDNPKIIRNYYRKLRSDMISGVDELFERLSKLAKSQKK